MGWITKRLGNGLWGTVDSENPQDAPHVFVDNTTTVSSADFTVALDYDNNGNLLYQGWAAPGSAKTSALWKIKKYVVGLRSGTYVTLDEQWANGSNDQTNIWNDRASLGYS